MLINILIASFIIVVTVIIHTGAMVLALQGIQRQVGGWRQRLRQTHLYWIGGIVLLMFFALLMEVLVWAVTYLACVSRR